MQHDRVSSSCHFYGVKKSPGQHDERIVAKAIKNELILYAIHTNLDNTLVNGVNEQIAHKLGLKSMAY
jgi:putative NIF3 family GTP cyclohydrolase 1 type 2